MASYTRHARRRMDQRGISDEDVESALEHRISETNDPRPGRRAILGFDASGGTLVVVVNGNMDVITVMRP